MKLIFFIITMIFCSDEYSFKKREFFIVTDRQLKGLVTKDGTSSDLLFLEDSTGCFGSDHLWDNYFPKPLMYQFNCEKIINLKAPVSLDINGIANNEEVLFKFTLNYDLKNITFSNFVDSSNTSITNALFTNEEYSDNIFMLSREAKNVESLKRSYKYYICTENITPLYREVLRNFFKYIKNIEDFIDNLNDIEYKKMMPVYEARRSLIIIFTTILQSFCSLRVFTFYQLSEIPKVEEFESLLNKICESLEDVVELYLKNKNGNEEAFILKKTKILDYINDFIIQDDSRSKCIEIYKKLFADRKSIVVYVYNYVKLGKMNTDLEILSDCSITKVDGFMKEHSALLLFYCVNFRDCDFKNFFTLYFARKSSEFDLLIKELEDLYIDRLIAGRLYCLIDFYKADKKEFLIFTQTDYFKHALSTRIIKNLKLLYNVNSKYNSSKSIKERLSFEQILVNQEHIGKALQDWNFILKKEESGEIKSFDDLLKEEKYSLPILENMESVDPNNS